MISKIVNITYAERGNTYSIDIKDDDQGEALWSTRSCRMLPPEIDFINKATRDFARAQEMMANTYTGWTKE